MENEREMLSSSLGKKIGVELSGSLSPPILGPVYPVPSYTSTFYAIYGCEHGGCGVGGDAYLALGRRYSVLCIMDTYLTTASACSPASNGCGYLLSRDQNRHCFARVHSCGLNTGAA
ncbi:hypothetical protein V3C99_003434 [Haemonchus contortus]